MSTESRTPERRSRHRFATCLFLASTGIGWLLPALAEETRWVNGSWVALHAQPSDDTPPLVHAHTNQAVELLSENGDWCEVLVVELGEEGYLRCLELGEAKLSLKSVEPHSFDYKTPNPSYSPSNSFWIDPSVPRLLRAGDHFESTQLTEEQYRYESGYDEEAVAAYDELLPPERHAIPEFEAMKDALTKGIVAGENARPLFVHWPTMQAKAQEHTNLRNGFVHDGFYAYGASVVTLQASILRPVTPSFFSSTRQLAPAHSGIEHLSANFDITARIRVTGLPHWVWPRHEGPMVAGSWDIGAFDHYLTSPVIEHVIGRQGLVGAKEWEASVSRDLGEEAEEGCDEGLYLRQRASNSLPDYPTVKDPLIWFYTAKPLPFRKARITTHAQRYVSEGMSLIVAHEIDIDDDGIADLAAIEQLGYERMDWAPEAATSVGLRIFFANVGGEWYLVDLDEFTECT